MRVEPVDDESPPTVVLGDHPLDVGLAVDEGDERRVLGGRRGRHDPVLVDLDDPLEDRRRRADPADPPAGHRVGLREAAHEDRPLAHPRQRAQGPVAVRAVGEPVVDLVAVDEQVVALGDRGELVLDAAGRTAPVGLHG